jgi:hypothetical protein
MPGYALWGHQKNPATKSLESPGVDWENPNSPFNRFDMPHRKRPNLGWQTKIPGGTTLFAHREFWKEIV